MKSSAAGRAHTRCCLLGKARPEAGPCLECSSEDELVVCHLWGAQTCCYLTLCPGAPSQNLPVSEGQDKAHWKLGGCFEWKVEECKVLF